MSDLNQFLSALTETINEAELQHITTDIAEAIGDSFLNDGILKDIPIIGTILGITKGTLNIRDKLFLKKMIYFLSQLAGIPHAERQKQIQKIEASKEYKTKVGEKLLFILEKSEDAQKAEITGKLFKAFLQEVISYDLFLKCCNAVQNLYISDITEFVQTKKGTMDVDKSSQFISTGLMKLVFVPSKLSESINMDRDLGNEYSLDPGITFTLITPIGIALKKALNPDSLVEK